MSTTPNHMIFIRSVLLIAAGAISAFGMAPTSFPPALLLGLSFLYIFYSGTHSPKAAALYSFSFFLGYFVHGLFWIGNALLVEGNEFAWVWPLSVIGLPTLLSVFYAFYFFLARKFSKPSTLSGYLTFILAISLSEWTRGHIFTGFPWNMSGYTWVSHLTIVQFASIGGIYLLSMLTNLWFSLPGWLIVSRYSWNSKALVTLVVMSSLLGVYVFGALRLNENPTKFNKDVTLRIVQANIEQSLKWKPESAAENFNAHLDLSEPYKTASTDKDHTTFIIWPETAIPPSLLASKEAGIAIQELLSSYPHEAILLSGALRRERIDTDTTYYNSLIALNARQEGIGLYDKSHLVPFGEYIPFQKFIPIKPVVSFTGFQAGEGPSTLFLDGLMSVTPLICYEAIFPAMARGGPQRPDLLVTITNDGWYGKSAGPYQHFSIASVRAIEQGTPLARSANTGISGIIDPFGRILAKTDLMQMTSISTFLPKSTESETLYRKYGDVMFLAFNGILCALQLLIFLKNRRKS